MEYHIYTQMYTRESEKLPNTKEWLIAKIISKFERKHPSTLL